MGILDRFSDIIASNVNKVLDKMEDPSKMVDQYLIKMTKNLEEVKKETVEVMAEEKRAHRFYTENRKEIDRYIGLTEKALLAGNEDDALIFMTKKQEIESIGVSLQKSYEVAKENSAKMKQMHNKLVNEINSLNNRRNMVKSKAVIVKTQESVNKFTSKTSDSGFDAFERMEVKVDSKLDKANALAELNVKPMDEAEALANKYASSTNNLSANEELETMKIKLGLLEVDSLSD